MKKIVRLTESDLTRIVKRVIVETRTVRLRTLTPKSILGEEGGSYVNWTVDKTLKNAPKKIYYLYCNYEKISFTDEVLKELIDKGFPVEKIDKPGVDKQQYRDYLSGGLEEYRRKLESKTLDELVKYLQAKRINRQITPPFIRHIIAKKKFELAVAADTKGNEVPNKERLTAFNQGKVSTI